MTFSRTTPWDDLEGVRAQAPYSAPPLPPKPTRTGCTTLHGAGGWGGGGQGGQLERHRGKVCVMIQGQYMHMDCHAQP